LLFVFANELSEKGYSNLNLSRQIAEKETAIENLQESEERYRSLMFNLNAGIVVHAPDTSIVMNNVRASELLGLSSDQIRGKKAVDLIWKFIDEKKIPLSPEEYPVNQIIRGRQLIKDQVMGILQPGKNDIVWVTVNGFPVLNAPGDITEIVISFIDVTERKISENQLVVSEQKLKEAQRIAHMGNWELNIGTNELFWSEEIFRIFDCEPHEFKATYEAFLEFIHPDDKELVNSAYLKSIETKNEYQIEHRVLTKNNQIKYVREKCLTTFNEQGKPLSSFGIVIDITEQKQIEKELAESTERFKALHNASFGGIAIHDKGTILECNQGLSEMTGYSLDELIGMDGLILIAPDHRETVMNNILAGYEKPYDAIGMRKNGEQFPIRLEARNIPYKGKNVRTVEFRDVTESKKAEEALRRSEERFHLAMKASSDGLFDWNLLTNEIYYSVGWKKMLGYEDHELPNDFSIWANLTEPGDVEKSWELQQQVILKQIDRFVMEFKMKHKDGHWVDILSRAEAIFNDDGKAVRIVGTHTDISERKQAEKTLRNRENLLNKVFDVLPIGLWFADESGRLIRGNPAGVKIWGAEPTVSIEEYGVFKARRLPSGREIGPDDWALARTIREGVTIGDELLEIDSFDGKKKIILNYTAPVLDDQGNIQGAVVVNQDITEAKHAELLLQEKSEEIAAQNEELQQANLELNIAKEKAEESKERYRSLLDNLEAGIVVHAPDTSIVLNNPKASELLGLSEDQMKGKTAIDEAWKFVNEDNTTLSIDEYPVNRIVKSKRPIKYQILGIHKPGKSDVNWVTVNGFPKLDNTGNITEIVISIIDVTERKQIEEALQKSELEFRLLAEAMPQIVWIADPAGSITYFNQQWMHYTGLTLDESCGDGWNKPFHPDDQQRARNAWQNATKHGATYSIECRLRRVDGEYKWWLVRGAPVYDANGIVLKWFGTCTDIDELVLQGQELIREKERAEESDHLKSAFLANMSHEIRTPMNGILGFASLLKEPDLTGEEQQNYIRIIERSGVRMLNTINNIVDIAKIEAGLMKVGLKESNINDQIEYIYNFFKPEVENKGMHLSFNNSLSSKEALIETDPEKIYAILTNLVKNAIKYTHEGSIELGYEKRGDYLQFFVKDTGIGIDKNRQEAIFERFIQADIFDSHAYQGSGLGLSISKAYVEMLGGILWVESERGKGSVFYFTIPYKTISQGQNSVTNIVSQKDESDQPQNLKILIADDDETSDFLITRILKKNNHVMFHAQTAVETIEVCRNNPGLDLILMDIRMPGMDGYEATRQIRQFNQKVIIIAQTAFGLSGDREKAIDAGCNEYLSKPIDKDELLRLMQKYFKK